MQSATPPAGHSTVRLGPCDYHGAEDTAFLAAAGPPPPASTHKSNLCPAPRLPCGTPCLSVKSRPLPHAAPS